MENREILVAVAAVLVAFAAGFSVGKAEFAPTLPQGFSQAYDFEVSSENDTRTFRFDNRSVGLLFSDGGTMRAFVDVDNDGIADRLLNTTQDGEEHTTTEIVTLEGKSYRLFFRYRDGPEEGDGSFRVYRVSEIV